MELAHAAATYSAKGEVTIRHLNDGLVLDQGATGGLVSNQPKVGAPKAAEVVNN